ncbi:hypothetical protein ACFL3B_00470 [Gemmatimonadota bacterium]
MTETSAIKRVVTVAEARTASSLGDRAATARKALATARSRKRIEAANNPKCPECDTHTVQNEPEKERRVYWCPRCQWYPFGDGFGPDVLPDEMEVDDGKNPG